MTEKEFTKTLRKIGHALNDILVLLEDLNDEALEPKMQALMDLAAKSRDSLSKELHDHDLAPFMNALANFSLSPCDEMFDKVMDVFVDLDEKYGDGEFNPYEFAA
jgi:hypothetical protein